MERSHTEPTFAWPLTLALSAILGTLATACMMPFVAVATLAAATMDRPRAIAAVLGVWAMNQLLGFGLLGYPITTYAAVWGLALGGASVAALLVARRMLGGAGTTIPMLAAAFATAFASYEGLLFLFSLAAGGTGTFTSAIIFRLFANDAGWLIGLAALHAVLTRVAPRVFSPSAALRFA